MQNLRNYARRLGSRGGKKSVAKRFANKTDEEKSKMMSQVRKGKKGGKV